jgi:type IV secretion system protein VirB9
VIGKILPLLLVALAEMGQAPVLPGMGDPRIQVLPYDADRVFTVRAATGFAVVVELAGDERVENIVVGNSGAWQVTANKRGDHLIIKPLGEAPPTDLVVSTEARRYVFLLQSAGQGEATPFVMRFDYPREAAAAVESVPAAQYKLRGDKALFPAGMSDDGKRTTVTWQADMPLPAIYATDEQGREAIVNGRMVGGSYVIEGVAPSYVFRLAKAHATATRRPVKVSR